jgi:hypothetical protein
MACEVTFDNIAPNGVISGTTTPNGIWELIGYSTVAEGPFGAGGNFPSVTTWGQVVDTSNIISGFYQFKYKSGSDPEDQCYAEALFVVPIIQGTSDVPSNIVIDLCNVDPIRNIFSDSLLFGEAAVNPVQFAITPPVGIGASYIPNSGSDVTDDQYDPSQEASYPITRIFTFDITPQLPAGTTLSGCDNCQTVQMTVTYNVTEQFDGGVADNAAACNDGT